ncbi:MAG: tetratricopeptide repeat protein [Bacteroidota bacterium]
MQTPKYTLQLLFLLAVSCLTLSFFQTTSEKVNSSDRLSDLIEQGKVALESSHYDLALTYFNQAADSAKLYFQTDQNETTAQKYLEVQNWIGRTFNLQRNLQDALLLFNEALDKTNPYLEENDLEVGLNHLFQAQTYRYQRELDKTEEQLMLAVPNLEHHQDTLSLIWLERTFSLLAYNRYDYLTSEKHCQKALDLIDENIEQYAFECARIYNQLGNLNTDQDNMTEGRACYEKALQLTRQSRTEPHLMYSIIYDNISRFHKISGSWDSMTVYANRFLESDKLIFGEEHENVARALRFVGMGHRMQGQFKYAKEHFERALDIRLKRNGEIHYRVANLYVDLGLVNYNMENYDEALSFYQKGLDVYLKTAGDKNSNIGVCYENIADIYEEKGEFYNALSYNLQALKLFEEIENEQRIIEAYVNLGNTYFKFDQPLKGQNYYIKAIDRARVIFPDKNGGIARMMENLASLLLDNSMNEEGLKYAQAVINELSLEKDWLDPMESFSLDYTFSEEDVLYNALSNKANALYALALEKKDDKLLSLSQHHYQLIYFINY